VKVADRGSLVRKASHRWKQLCTPRMFLSCALEVELPVGGLWESPTGADWALTVTQAHATRPGPEALDQILAELHRGRAAGLPAGGPVA
jgi:hypothetical protein